MVQLQSDTHKEFPKSYSDPLLKKVATQQCEDTTSQVKGPQWNLVRVLSANAFTVSKVKVFIMKMMEPITVLLLFISIHPFPVVYLRSSH